MDESDQLWPDSRIEGEHHHFNDVKKTTMSSRHIDSVQITQLTPKIV